jgi:hypothetical protein
VYGKGVVFAFPNVDRGSILSVGTIAKRLIWPTDTSQMSLTNHKLAYLMITQYFENINSRRRGQIGVHAEGAEPDSVKLITRPP